MPGDIKYRDIDGDGVITSEDQVMLSPYGDMPRVQYGLGLNVRWKKFDLGVFFNGSAKTQNHDQLRLRTILGFRRRWWSVGIFTP